MTADFKDMTAQAIKDIEAKVVEHRERMAAQLADTMLAQVTELMTPEIRKAYDDSVLRSELVKLCTLLIESRPEVEG